jgi:acyl dehydratase
MTPPLPPRDQRYREHYIPGAVYAFGEVELSEAAIIAFAEQFDPQPALHIDPRLAAHNAFGGLIASGWHTLGAMMRLYVDHYLSTVANWVSPGVDKVRWLKPVRPGTRLSIRVTILENRTRKSDPDQGAILALVEGLDQDGQCVASLEVTRFVFSRPRPGA